MRSSLLVSAALLAGTSVVQAQNDFFTYLTGHQQVPSVASPAEDLVFVSYRLDTFFVATLDTLTLTSPIDENVGAHVHTGFIGQNGPVMLPLAFENIGTNGDGYALAKLKDTFYIPRPGLRDTLLSAMREGRAYINVHSLLFGGGEVRGQIVDLAVDDAFDAMLYGDQENPAILSDGMGGVLLEVVGNQITVSGSFRLDNPAMPVAGSPAHLHIGLFGENGPVAFPLTAVLAGDKLSGVFRRADNVFTLTPAQLDTLEARNMYANIHSVANPSGEIRGQVVGVGNNLYFSHVSYDNPTAFPNPRARMRIMAEKPALQNGILFSGSYAGWANEVAARNLGVFVQIGNPFGGTPLTVVGLPTRPGANPGEGRIPSVGRAANANQLDGLYQRYTPRAGFVQGSTVAYDSDFYHECKRAFYSTVTPSQEVSSTPSRGRGEVITEYYTNRIEINGLIQGLTDTVLVNGIHIHEGMAGESGPIVAPIDFFRLGTGVPGAAILPSLTIINLTDDQAATMRDRGFYYNFHTSNYPNGEVRGQIAPRANVMYHAIVEPQQAMPGGGPTDAYGAVLIEADEARMVATGSFSDLSGFNPAAAGGAHLHAGLPGVSGAIKYPLKTSAATGAEDGAFLPADNTFLMLSAATLDSLTNREFYVNIHSTTVPSGEIRGQVGPLSTNVVASRLSPNVTIPYTGMLGMNRGTGRLTAELYDTTAVIAGSFMRVSSRIDTTIAGGAHMHAGTVGQSGPIVFPIKFALGGGDTSAIVMPRSNVRQLTPTQRAALLKGDVYANVHTVVAPSGHIRGQMLLAENEYPDAVEDFSFPQDGATVDLGSGAVSTVATIDWDDSDDADAEQDIAYIWQLYADTSLAPVVQTMASAMSNTTFTFGQLDTLLASLGVAEGASATVFHRAWTTDGSLLTPSDFATVTLKRRLVSSVRELPAGAAHLVNNLGARSGHTMFLDINDLPAGRYTYDITTATGQRLSQVGLDHSGATQRYEILGTPNVAGMYFLRLTDANGRASGWGFMVQ